MKFFLGENPGFYIGNLHIAWYGLIMACSMALAVVLCYFLFSKQRNVKNTEILCCALYVLPFAIIGARAFYVAFNPMGASYSFVDALKIWEGGMSIWGGVIGGFIGVCLYCLIHKKDLLSICDIIAPALILAQSTGRWGNFINQEAHGWEVFDPNFFGLPFTVEINGHYYLATFLYEAVLNTIGFIVLVTLLYKTKKRGLVMSCYLMWYGVVRSVIETFRTDQMLIGSLPFSQLTAIIAAVIGLGIFIYIFVRDHKNKQKQALLATNENTQENLENNSTNENNKKLKIKENENGFKNKLKNSLNKIKEKINSLKNNNKKENEKNIESKNNNEIIIEEKSEENQENNENKN